MTVKLLHFVKPLHGLTDSGDLWFQALSKFIERTLGLTPTAYDPGMYFDAKEQTGVLSTYVDDILVAGTATFLENINKIRSDFSAKDPKFSCFTYGGIQISQKDNEISARQTQYASSIKLLPSSATFAEYRSTQAKLQ